MKYPDLNSANSYLFTLEWRKYFWAFDLFGSFNWFSVKCSSRILEPTDDFETDPNQNPTNFTLSSVCAVIFQGNIHFFGGENTRESRHGIDYSQQHFGFDEKRNFVRYRELGMSLSWRHQVGIFTYPTGMSFSKATGFVQPQCTSHKIWLDATEFDVVL